MMSGDSDSARAGCLLRIAIIAGIGLVIVPALIFMCIRYRDNRVGLEFFDRRIPMPGMLEIFQDYGFSPMDHYVHVWPTDIKGVERIWWNERIVAAATAEMGYWIVDVEAKCSETDRQWPLAKEYSTEREFMDELRKITLPTEKLALLDLHSARLRREAELGHPFTLSFYARYTNARYNMRDLCIYLSIYRGRQGHYPKKLADLNDLDLHEGAVLPSLVDPWGNPYKYSLDKSGACYSLWCMGPPGTKKPLIFAPEWVKECNRR